MKQFKIKITDTTIGETITRTYSEDFFALTDHEIALSIKDMKREITKVFRGAKRYKI